MIIVLIILLIVVATVTLIIFIEIRKRRALSPVKTGFKEKEMCVNCKSEISSSDVYCPICGKSVDPRKLTDEGITLEEKDEEVYDYMVKHGGAISWDQAPKDLEISREELEKYVEKLKKAGRIAKANGDS